MSSKILTSTIILFFLSIQVLHCTNQLKNVEITFETHDFEQDKLCCARCDSSINDPSKPNCKIIMDYYRMSWEKHCNASLNLHHRTTKIARGYRLVPLEENETNKLQLAWLDKNADGNVYLAVKFMDFNHCVNPPTQRYVYNDEANVLMHMYGMHGDLKHDISFENYDVCGTQTCNVTLIKK